MVKKDYNDKEVLVITPVIVNEWFTVTSAFGDRGVRRNVVYD